MSDYIDDLVSRPVDGRVTVAWEPDSSKRPSLSQRVCVATWTDLESGHSVRSPAAPNPEVALVLLTEALGELWVEATRP